MAAAGVAEVVVRSEGADVVTLDGPGVVPTVWHADGAAEAVVPMLLIGDTATIEVNGQPQRLVAGAEAIDLIDADAVAAGWVDPPDQRTVIAAAVLGLAIVVGVALVGRRWLTAAVAVAAVGGFTAWLAMSPLVQVGRGTVFVEHADGRIVADQWVWHLTRAGATVRVPVDHLAWPVVRSTAELERVGPMLHVDAEGQPFVLELTLPPDVRVATVERSDVEAAGVVDGEERSRLRTLVRKRYQRPGVRVAAEASNAMLLRHVGGR
jgi:hypothetical protein